MIKRFFKKLFCKHYVKEQEAHYPITNGRVHPIYYSRCKNCGKVWWP